MKIQAKRDVTKKQLSTLRKKMKKLKEITSEIEINKDLMINEKQTVTNNQDKIMKKKDEMRDALIKLIINKLNKKKKKNKLLKIKLSVKLSDSSILTNEKKLKFDD